MLGVASSGWYKVRLSDGTVGYASNKNLKEPKPGALGLSIGCRHLGSRTLLRVFCTDESIQYRN